MTREDAGEDDDWEDFEDDEDDEDEHDDGDTVEHQHDPKALQDAHVSETVARRALLGRYCWAAALGWMAYRNGVWKPTTEAAVCERVRRDLIGQQTREANAGADQTRLAALLALLAAARIRAIVSLCRGILEVESTDFDRHPDRLNVANGVVDLRTGELLDHDAALYLTKTTTTAYVAGAISSDWATALEAVPPEVADWLQVRFGQAASGHMTPDDLLGVLQGSGSNGKTTVLGGISTALGDHAVIVSERLLMGNPGDHPTEMMPLRGARLALLEETPEARHLNVQRLKATIGTPVITARAIRMDNVSWSATHSLFIATNHRPRIDETDHGTWRRLALVRFPFTYRMPNAGADRSEGPASPLDRVGVPGLRERLRHGGQGQHEAVLAWIVEGARRWYDADRVMPAMPAIVVADTMAWRAEADLIVGFILEVLVFDRSAHVITGDVYDAFKLHLERRGHQAWTETTFGTRFTEHGMVEAEHVVKRRIRPSPGLSRQPTFSNPPTAQYSAYLGLRFRTAADDTAENVPDAEGASEQAKQARVQGVQALIGEPRAGALREVHPKVPAHPAQTPSSNGHRPHDQALDLGLGGLFANGAGTAAAMCDRCGDLHPIRDDGTLDHACTGQSR